MHVDVRSWSGGQQGKPNRNLQKSHLNVSRQRDLASQALRLPFKEHLFCPLICPDNKTNNFEENFFYDQLIRGTFLSCLSCFLGRWFSEFRAENPGMIPLVSHPTVWNPKSKDCWETNLMSLHVFHKVRLDAKRKNYSLGILFCAGSPLELPSAQPLPKNTMRNAFWEWLGTPRATPANRFTGTAGTSRASPRALPNRARPALNAEDQNENCEDGRPHPSMPCSSPVP